MFKGLEVNKDSIKSSIHIIIFLLILNLLAGNIGFLSDYTIVVIVIFLYIALLLYNVNFKLFFNIFRKPKEKSYPNLIVGIVFIIFSFIILLSTFSRELWLFQLPIFIIGLNYFLFALDEKRKEFFTLTLTTFLYASFFLIVQNIPQIFNSISAFSLVISKSISSISETVILGSSMSGLWIILTFFFFSLSLFLLSEKQKKYQKFKLFIFSILGIVISWFIFIILESMVFFVLTDIIILLHFLIFILNLIIVLPFVIKLKKISLLPELPKFKTFKNMNTSLKWKTIALCVLLFSSGLFLTTFTPGFKINREKNIAFYNPGIGTFNLPENGVHGKKASGMFGFLSIYLSSTGYSVDTLNENFTKDTLTKYDTLVFINLDERFSEEKLKLIWEYVHDGGSLFVLGDHTDIGGIREPLNTLLRPAGISFRFDSGIPLKVDWKSCYQLLHHPINEGITPNDEMVGISVGATLDITSPAFPLIVGKEGFSDIGDYKNAEKAFLGDYVCNYGEQSGDIILVAGAYYGNGRVIVFGDTSSIQNLALPNTHRFVSNIMKWLVSDNTETLFYSRIILSLIFVGLVIILIKGLVKKIFIVIPIILIVALISSTVINSISYDESKMGGPISYIDISHDEHFNGGLAESDSISALIVNIARNSDTVGNRYLPMLLRDFNEEKILKSRMLILIAPTKSFSQSEINIIETFIHNGGLVILSAGYEDKKIIQPLIDVFGFDISSSPLGPVPYGDKNSISFKNEPRFVDAWPILLENNENDTKIFYSVSFDNTSYPIVIAKKIGAGGILFIADNRFLLDGNLENLLDEADYWQGNLNFIKNLIDEVKNMGMVQ
ncbi:MAG: hypothetical protein NT038_10895 [Euryarchaeota archaeon]|nr:hypothetical protein [Euryarchaeota archaeon]